MLQFLKNWHVSEYDDKTLTSMFRKANRLIQKGTATGATLAAMKKYTTYVAAMDARKADDAKVAPEILNLKSIISSFVQEEKEKCV